MAENFEMSANWLWVIDEFGVTVQHELSDKRTCGRVGSYRVLHCNKMSEGRNQIQYVDSAQRRVQRDSELHVR